MAEIAPCFPECHRPTRVRRETTQDLGRGDVRRTATGVKRLIAGAFIGAFLTLGMAGPAFAQSPSPAPNPSGSPAPTPGGGAGGGAGGGTAGTTTAARTAGTPLGGRTGAELWIPLTVGGGTVIIALGARRLLGRIS